MVHNLLLIQDAAADATAVREALAASLTPSFTVEWVRSCADALRYIAAVGKQSGPDSGGVAAILVDLNLADSQGIATFDTLFAAVPQIPILILSAVIDEELAKLAVQRGAQDYFFKDRLDSFLLPKALAGMVDRAANTEALFEEKERAQVTLDSIGDAVISSDVEGHVTYLNVVAERLTGWSRADASGHPLEEVFHIVDAITHEPVPNPMRAATHENKTVGLTPNCVLVNRDGGEAAIEDSAAPIHDRRGQVTGAVMVFRDVSTARALSQRMAYLAQHDSLTDLPNRTLLNDRLAQAVALVHRHGQRLAVLYLDVDRFKHINDSLGHATGDRLLQSVGRRLRDCVRASDTVSRQGGDEFVVLLSEVVHERDAAICAEKILRSLRAPHQVDEHDIHVTASIGIVVYPDDGTNPEELLKNADFAMYQAKDSGRNNYQFYKAALNSSANKRQLLESDLRRAVHNREFELHYQPIVNLSTGVITGAEALIRWHHPVRGLLPPGEFIPIAEESGLVVPIGEWVLAAACRQGRAWRNAGLRPLALAINISAVELRAAGFADRVRAILDETGFDPQCLELELTETYLMQDSHSTAEVLRTLKEMGILLALDDFGTGYSSLSYMRRFPIDILKVDRSFVRDLTSDANDANIVSAIINMGRSLRMSVTAEGVETQQQLAFLEGQDCPEAQGFYFSHPVVSQEFAALLRHGIAH